MSLDIINNLPTELLNHVFDNLTLRERRNASTVCIRWWKVLLDDKFYARHKLRLRPDQLLEEHFDFLKKQHSVQVNDCWFYAPVTLRMLNQYLCNKELVEKLTEIKFSFQANAWNSTFGTEQEMNFPNVQKMYFSVYKTGYLSRMQCRIVAPRLKFVYVNDLIVRPLLVQYDNQIERLGIGLETCIFRAIDGLPFLNLRWLALKINTTTIKHFYSYKDFSAENRSMLGRLTYLHITDWEGLFSSVYSLILQEAKQLKSLHIYGGNLEGNDLIQLNRLKELKNLTLLMNINDQQTSSRFGLSLPHLASLKTFASSLVPLENVPAITSLAIANNEKLKEQGSGFHHHNLDEYFRPFAHQLETLKLVEVYLNDWCIDQICTLTNLTSFTMTKIEANIAGVEKIFNCLTNLRQAVFKDCNIAERVVACEDDSDCECDICMEGYDGYCSESEESEKERHMTFYGDLAKKYVDCNVSAVGGRVVHCFISSFCNIHETVFEKDDNRYYDYDDSDDNYYW